MSATMPLSPRRMPASPSSGTALRPVPPLAQAFALSDPGLLRAKNEDAWAVVPRVSLYAVADGVGGNAAGEVASRLAIDSVVAFFEDLVFGRSPSPADAHELAWQATFARALFVRAVEEANALVSSAAAGDAALTGMATTFTGLLLLQDHAVLAHLGDSRAYRFRGRRLDQLTEDHTLVAAYVQAGRMTPDEAATSPLRGRLLRALGHEDLPEIDTRVVPVESGDVFLLCSDGLHEVIGDEAIAAVLRSELDVTAAATKLVQRANDAGGPDNITAVLVRVA